jgi:hypothetical protein
MSSNPGVPPCWLRRCAAGLLLLLAGCSHLPPTSAVAIPPIPTGAARIWVYRDGGVYDSQERPYLRLNGQVAGISEPDGAFYRDVPLGHYVVSVDSYGVPFPNQFAELDLGPGQQAFIKVLSMREKVGGEAGVGLRTLFFTQLVAAQTAQAAIATTPFYGSS